MKKDITDLLNQIEEAAGDLHPLQKRIIKSGLKNLEQTFEAQGEYTSYDDTKLLLWEYSMMSAEKEIFAIATNRQTLSGFGFSQDKNHIDIQTKVIEKGVKIHRIFAVDQEQYENFDFMELVRAQLKAGVDVWVAYLNVAQYINSDMEKEQENYVIIDDKILYRSFAVGRESRNSITFDKDLIIKYRKMFEELRNRSYKFKSEDLPKAFTEL